MRELIREVTSACASAPYVRRAPLHGGTKPNRRVCVCGSSRNLQRARAAAHDIDCTATPSYYTAGDVLVRWTRGEACAHVRAACPLRPEAWTGVRRVRTTVPWLPSATAAAGGRVRAAELVGPSCRWFHRAADRSDVRSRGPGRKTRAGVETASRGVCIPHTSARTVLRAANVEGSGLCLASFWDRTCSELRTGFNHLFQDKGLQFSSSSTTC
jgi:hypothetical protein